MNQISGEKYQSHTMRQLTSLLFKFPKLRVIWSTSYLDTICLMRELKRNAVDADPNRFSPQGDGELEIAEEGEEAEESVFDF